ncbi:MAG: hypothetical protein LUH82_05720 [Clostridiales bacterium]|nr:hypothetical protein [Clostridiales bacterium]
MKKYNYFDDVPEKEINVRRRFAEKAAKKITAALAGKISQIKKRVLSGESLAAIIAGALQKRKKAVPALAAAVCVLLLALAVGIPGAAISQNIKKEKAFRQDAGEVCSNLISEYGAGRAEAVTDSSGGSYYSMTGLSYVRQIDFDNDSKYELLAVYENGGEYFIEIWGYVKGEFSAIFSAGANTAGNSGLGSWVSLYNNRGRYYIGVLSDDGVTMQLYTKSGKKFKEKKECRYDAEDDIYVLDDKINESDFETVRLSYISDSAAQSLIDSAEAVIEQLAISVSETNTAETQLSTSEIYALYADTVEGLEAQYGKADYKTAANICSASGVCVVRLIDFNGDETPEMLVVFSYDKHVLSSAANGNAVTVTQPAYKLRVYAEKDNAVKMIYETDTLTSFQGSDTEQFYILQTSGEKTNLCSNTYSYSSTSTRVWKATSRIRAMSDDFKFETAFTAVANCNWGYMSYSIDGAVVYSREFSTRGYVVPYFCTDSADYDESEFTVGFVCGGESYIDEVKNTVAETKEQIKELDLAQ